MRKNEVAARKFNLKTAAPVNLNVIFAFFFFAFYSSFGFHGQFSPAEQKSHDMSHYCTHSPHVSSVSSAPHIIFFIPLNLFLWQRRWENTSLLLLDAPRCQSHPTLRTFERLFFFLFPSVLSEFSQSALHKLSRWSSISVKRASHIHVATFLLFVCFVKTCTHARQKQTNIKHNSQFQRPHAQMHKRRHALEVIT